MCSRIDKRPWNWLFLRLRSKQKDLFYFKEKRECDFVVRVGSKITEAYQVCYTIDDTNKEREIKGLVEALEKFNLKEGFILTLNQEDNYVIDGRKIKVKPVWKWLGEER